MPGNPFPENSSSFDTARAPGTSKIFSPAGTTSTCPTQGRIEAKSAGAEIRKAGIKPDIVFTSVLKRAIRTLWSVLDEMDLMWMPVERSWRLNERHYGALQGLDKAQTVEKHGEAQVKIWRRSYDIPPPPLAARRRAPPALRPPLRERRSARAAGLRIAQGHARARVAVLE